jgi:transcriptional regulator with XRE-family HTH domain
MTVFMQALSPFSGIDPYDEAMSQGRPAKRQRSLFGQRLFELREAASITQVAIAERLGVSQRTYSDWERGSVAFTPSRLSELASILGVEPAVLLGTPAAKQRITAGSGRIAQSFEAISKLTRRKQGKILDVVDALLSQQTAGKA